MSKEEWFVIKNQKGKYWCWDLNKIVCNQWDYSISKATLYYNYKEADEQCKKIRACHEECEIVKVVIKEIENE
jgi:hypothetical protein